MLFRLAAQISALITGCAWLYRNGNSSSARLKGQLLVGVIGGTAESGTANNLRVPEYYFSPAEIILGAICHYSSSRIEIAMKSLADMASSLFLLHILLKFLKVYFDGIHRKILNRHLFFNQAFDLVAWGGISRSKQLHLFVNL